MSRKENSGISINWRAKAMRLKSASVGVCLLLVLLTSCTQPTPPPDPASITFAYLDWYGEHFEALLDEFNESHPHITVELYSVSRQVFSQSFWAGEADAFVGSTGSTEVRMMLEQDLLMNLAPFIRADAAFNPERFYSGENAFLLDEGRIWGVPYGSSTPVMYYNRDLFDRYGVAYPEIGWTWDDFLDAALALRDPDDDVFGYVATDSQEAAHFVYQHGGRLYNDLRAPTYPEYDDPLTVEAMAWYAALFLEHNVAPTPNQLRESFGEYHAVDTAILSGRAGMWIGQLGEQGGLEEWFEWGFAWGMAPLPRDTRAATLVNSNQLFIFADAQDPDACWEWLSFVSQHMSPRWLAPMRSSLGESEAYEQLVGDEVAAIVREVMPDVLTVSPEADGAMRPLGQAVERIVMERDTPQEAMDWAQQEAERIFP
jgi:multiple sugar transport system substrate-binding protein